MLCCPFVNYPFQMVVTVMGFAEHIGHYYCVITYHLIPLDKAIFAEDKGYIFRQCQIFLYNDYNKVSTIQTMEIGDATSHKKIILIDSELVIQLLIEK